MACDATARLYDVDEDTVKFKKLQKTEKYDQGTITFRARKGQLIDLDKLHESIRATRLSGGTSSGLVHLDVTAIGQIITPDGQTRLKVSGSDAEFVLLEQAETDSAAAFGPLLDATGKVKHQVRVTGRIDNYQGRWPNVLRQPPTKPRRILVTSLEMVK